MKTREQIAKEQGLDIEDIFTIKDFIVACDYGVITPSDGHGYFHTGEEETDISCWNNKITFEEAKKYPYICWYNK